MHIFDFLWVVALGSGWNYTSSHAKHNVSHVKKIFKNINKDRRNSVSVTFKFWQ